MMSRPYEFFMFTRILVSEVPLIKENKKNNYNPISLTINVLIDAQNIDFAAFAQVIVIDVILSDFPRTGW